MQRFLNVSDLIDFSYSVYRQNFKSLEKTIDNYLQLFDHNSRLEIPLHPHPTVAHQTIIKHDPYNYCIIVIFNTLIYFYHLTPITFPWNALNQPLLLDSLRSIILTTILNNAPPTITFPQNASIATTTAPTITGPQQNTTPFSLPQNTILLTRYDF